MVKLISESLHIHGIEANIEASPQHGVLAGHPLVMACDEITRCGLENEVWPSFEALNCMVSPFRLISECCKRRRHIVNPGAF
jgi:hypothetical protein